MTFADDEIQELKSAFSDAMVYEEGGYTFFLLPQVQMPKECTPARMDLLLCPTDRGDGYPSRLFFSERVAGPGPQPNWNSSVRIIERTWHAYSWKRPGALRLAQMVADHLGALR